MHYLTPDETRVLRITLGLHTTCRRGVTQNYLPPNYARELSEAVDSLVARGYLRVRDKDLRTMWGVWKAGTYAATDAGREAVMDEPWK